MALSDNLDDMENRIRCNNIRVINLKGETPYASLKVTIPAWLWNWQRYQKNTLKLIERAGAWDWGTQHLQRPAVDGRGRSHTGAGAQRATGLYTSGLLISGSVETTGFQWCLLSSDFKKKKISVLKCTSWQHSQCLMAAPISSFSTRWIESRCVYCVSLYTRCPRHHIMSITWIIALV